MRIAAEVIYMTDAVFAYNQKRQQAQKFGYKIVILLIFSVFIRKTDLVGIRGNWTSLTELTLAVGGRYRRVPARAVSQADVKQADPTSTSCDSLTVVVRFVDVQKTSDRFVEVKRCRQLVAVTVQRLHRRRVSTSERLRHRYQRNGQVLFVPAHPLVPASFTVTYPVVREQHNHRVPQALGLVQRQEEPFQKVVGVHGFVVVSVRQRRQKREGEKWTLPRDIACDHLYHISYLQR